MARSSALTASRSKGSGISGVTGLRAREGRSSMLGDRISGIFLGEKAVAGELGLDLPVKDGIIGLIIFRFFMLPRRS